MIFYSLCVFLFLFLCLVLCLVILVQESKSSGLGATFGGEGGESLFGTATPDILKKITAYLATAFLIGSVILSLWTGALSKAKQNRTSPAAELIEK